MTEIVQDDNGSVEDANSYQSVADFKAYHDARGNDYSDFDDAAISTALVRATDYLDNTFNFIGTRGSTDQSTKWPRDNAYDRDGYLVLGIPKAVKKATNEYGLIAAKQEINPNPTRDETGQRVIQMSETVGPISESKTFASGAAFSMPVYPVADSMLKSAGLVVAGSQIIRG